MEIKRKRYLLAISMIIVFLLLIVLAIVGLFLLKPAPMILQGQVEATEVRISGKLPGRIVQVMVEEGEHVKIGDTLVHIHSSLVEAQLVSANAMRNAALAENKMIDAGTRTELVRSAHDLMLQAQAARTIAEKTYHRMESLYAKGVVSEQKRDEAQAAYDMAVAAENAAAAQYQIALRGARQEEKEIAAAMVDVASGGVAEVESLLEDSYLTSPNNGVVDDIFPQIGELVSLGAPIMNIVLLDDIWVTFNVREDMLFKFPIGGKIEAYIPALEGRDVTLEVFYVKDMGTYAVWRATRATGEYDAKTFTIKARPDERIEGLLPGMSVLVKEKRK